MRLLLVEDDLILGSSLKKALEKHAYGVDWMKDGEAAIAGLEDLAFDVVVLDVNLPGLNGIEVLRSVRKNRNAVPILLLTARDTSLQKVEGLDNGADDYLVKPFDFGELLARVRALQRRPRNVDAPVLSRGQLALDPLRHQVTVRGAPLSLTSTEYNILELLLRRSPAVVDRKAIAEHAWHDETQPLGSNAIDVQLSRLRAKLPNAGIRIVTVRGAGYRLEDA